LLGCSPPTGPTLQSAAVEALSRYDDPKVVNGFLQIWPILTPVARARAISALLSRDSQVANVLVAVQTGRISASELSSAQKNFLRTHSIPAIRQRALELLGPVPMSLPTVTERFKLALSLRGAPERGGVIFRQRCADCHVPSGRDSTLGPELLRARTYTKDRLLSRILEPNLVIRPDYATQVVESKEGQDLVGIVTDENAATVTLMQPGGDKIVWPQLNIRSIEPKSWSLMPDGLEQGLSAQDMADLMEYILRGMK
jgi:putative heme-binding domain-containing protein